MSRAFRCEVCDGEPMWSITRIGDVASTWACPADLSAVCDRMQRDFEVTELRVTHHAKAREWAELGRILSTGDRNDERGRHGHY